MLSFLVARLKAFRKHLIKALLEINAPFHSYSFETSWLPASAFPALYLCSLKAFFPILFSDGAHRGVFYIFPISPWKA